MKRHGQRKLLPLILAVFTCTSFAQSGGGMGSMGGGRRSQMGMPSNRSTMGEMTPGPASLNNQVADRLYDLRMRLLITKEQTALWDAFYAKVMALTADLGHGQSSFAGQTAVQAVAQRLNQAQNRYALTEQLSDALKNLYPSLTPEQQAIADQYLPPVIPGLDGGSTTRSSVRFGTN